MTPRQAGQVAGFTLTEVLVAMGLLAVGMVGILSLFSAAVSLQREAKERMDVALLLPGVMEEVRSELQRRLGEGSEGGGATPLGGVEVPVPANPRYSYRVHVEQDPGDPSGRVVLCRVELLAKVRGRSKAYDFGYLPVILDADNDKLIRDLIGR